VAHRDQNCNGNLPTFVAPMLGKPGKPFDSDDYLFEILSRDGGEQTASLDDLFVCPLDDTWR
jgi:hypothetical protein